MWRGMRRSARHGVGAETLVIPAKVRIHFSKRRLGRDKAKANIAHRRHAGCGPQARLNDWLALCVAALDESDRRFINHPQRAMRRSGDVDWLVCPNAPENVNLRWHRIE